MPIDLKSLKKLETLAPSAAVGSRDDDDALLVLVKLFAGAARPAYVTMRGRISDLLFSAEIRASELKRLEDDPAVESVAISRPLAIGN